MFKTILKNVAWFADWVLRIKPSFVSLIRYNMIIQWGSEEQRMAESLIKQASNASDIQEAIELIRKAIALFDETSYHIKLSNYLLKNSEQEEAISVLLRRISFYEGAVFNFCALPEMNISILHSHLGTQFNKTGQCLQSVQHQTLSVLYLSIAFSVQERRVELEQLLEGATSLYFGQVKFSKPFKQCGLDYSIFSKEFDCLLRMMKSDLMKIISRVKFLNKEKVAHEKELMEDVPFWESYTKLKKIKFKDEMPSIR